MSFTRPRHRRSSATSGLSLLVAAVLAGCSSGSPPGSAPVQAPPPSYWRGSRFKRLALPFELPTDDSPGGAAPTYLVSYDVRGVRHLVAGGLHESEDCTFAAGVLRCTSLPFEVVCAGDLDGDGLEDFVTAEGQLVTGAGSQSEVADPSHGLVAVCVVRPGELLVGTSGGCDPARPASLAMYELSGGSLEPVPIEQPEELRAQANVYWGPLLGHEMIVAPGGGCGDPDEPMFFVRQGDRFAPFYLPSGPVGTRGTPLDFRSPMGVAVFDADGDSHDDLVVTIDPQVVLLLGDGHGGLEPAPYDPGFHQKDKEGHDLVGWGAVALDLDGDGRQDLCVANGYDDARRQLGWTEPWWPTCFWNGGHGRFANVTHDLGLDEVLGQWWNIEAVDVDGDGHQDLLVGGQASQPAVLLWTKG